MPLSAQAIIFDLDGTLLNSLDDLADSANAALAAAGFATHPVDAYRLFVGNGMETLTRRAAPKGLDEANIQALYLAVHDHFAGNWHNRTRPYAGVERVLRALSARHIPFAVVSNKPHEFTGITVQHFFPKVSFVSVLGKTAMSRGKPDPELALATAEKFGVRPANILFVGDSGVDMDTAVNAGMIPAGALWGFRSREELVEHGARVLIEHPRDIVRYC